MTKVLEKVPEETRYLSKQKFTQIESELADVLHMIWSNRIAINANDIEALKEYARKNV